MASFADNFQTVRFTGKTFVLSVGVLLLVIGLFFIPEIVSFQRSLAGKPGVQTASNGQPSSTSGEYALVPQAEPEVEPRASLDRGESPLERVKHLANRDGAVEAPIPSEAKPEKVAQQAPAQVQTGPHRAPAAEFFKAFSVKAGGMNEATRSTPDSSIPADWQPIRGREGQNAMKQARQNAVKFLEAFEYAPNPVRHAVYSYVSGLDYISKGADKEMSAESAIKYIEDLQYQSTRALVRSGAQRGVIMNWAEVSSLPFVPKSRTEKVKTGYETYFSPKMILSNVEIRQRVKNPKETEEPPVSFRAELVVLSRDVKSMRLYKNDEFNRQLNLPRPDGTGRRVIRLTGDAREKWTIVAYDKYGGEPFVKSYSFFPRVKRFRHQKDGRYEITLSASDRDSRLDQFFTTDPMIGVGFETF